MGCNKNKCPLILKSTSVVVSNGLLVITVPTTTLQDPQCFGLVICQKIPLEGMGLPVVISDGILIVAYSDLGNYVQGYQLVCRKCYKVYYSNYPTHITFVCNLPENPSACGGCGNSGTVGVAAIAENIIADEISETVNNANVTTADAIAKATATQSV